MQKVKASFVIFSLMLACTACGESTKPVNDGGITFNQQAAGKLTPEQLRKMDIEFFNEFDVHELPTAERKQRIIALAEAGFEPAWLALRLYDFVRVQPSFNDDYAIYWHRLKDLADSGNASAQCLFPEIAGEYEHWRKKFDLNDLPTHENEVSLNQYRDAAAAQGQSYCFGRVTRKVFQEGEVEKGKQMLRQCAHEGNSDCESWIAISYITGSHGLPKDNVKGLCWHIRAYEHNRAPSLLSFILDGKQEIRREKGEAKRDAFLQGLTPETDCDLVHID